MDLGFYFSSNEMVIRSSSSFSESCNISANDQPKQHTIMQLIKISRPSSTALPRRWRRGSERSACKHMVGSSNPSSNRPESLKQVVTAPLPNARHWVRVSRPINGCLFWSGTNHSKQTLLFYISKNSKKGREVSSLI